MSRGSCKTFLTPAFVRDPLFLPGGFFFSFFLPLAAGQAGTSYVVQGCPRSQCEGRSLPLRWAVWKRFRPRVTHRHMSLVDRLIKFKPGKRYMRCARLCRHAPCRGLRLVLPCKSIPRWGRRFRDGYSYHRALPGGDWREQHCELRSGRSSLVMKTITGVGAK